MRIDIGGGERPYRDVGGEQGEQLVADGPEMRKRPTTAVLQGGPGAGHTTRKPEFTAAARNTRVVRRLDGHRGGDGCGRRRPRGGGASRAPGEGRAVRGRR